MASHDGEINSWRGSLDKKSDYCVECVSDVRVCRCVSVLRSSAEQCVNPEDESEGIVCDVAYQSKSAGFCPADPFLFTGTDVTISNFRVC